MANKFAFITSVQRHNAKIDRVWFQWFSEKSEKVQLLSVAMPTGGDAKDTVAKQGYTIVNSHEELTNMFKAMKEREEIEWKEQMPRLEAEQKERRKQELLQIKADEERRAKELVIIYAEREKAWQEAIRPLKEDPNNLQKRLERAVKIGYLNGTFYYVGGLYGNRYWGETLDGHYICKKCAEKSIKDPSFPAVVSMEFKEFGALCVSCGLDSRYTGPVGQGYAEGFHSRND